jgi:hypothetical protein
VTPKEELIQAHKLSAKKLFWSAWVECQSICFPLAIYLTAIIAAL